MKITSVLRNRPGMKRLVLALGICLAVLMVGRTVTQAASCLKLADIPLDTMQEAAPGMVMFVIDDSGSMDWSVMCPPADHGTNAIFNNYYYIFTNAGDNLSISWRCIEDNGTQKMRWMSQWFGYNGMYYDPTTNYTSWPGFQDADPDNPRSDPVRTTTFDLTANWQTWSTSTSISPIARRHYYIQNNTGTYLVNLFNGSIEYYQVNLTNPSRWQETVTLSKLSRLTNTAAQNAGIVTGRTYAEEIQNFANWYSYYRRREYTAKAAIADIINTSEGLLIGLQFLNSESLNQPVLPVNAKINKVEQDQSATLLNVLLNQYAANGSTWLRRGLCRAGQYFDGRYMNSASNYYTDVHNSSSYPFFITDYGGSCQQAFTIIFSDGVYNCSYNNEAGNADNDNNTDYDGSPFGDTYSNTLADIAMHFYERDLNDDLPNLVPASNADPASHQHMVTYTIAFGVVGSLNPTTFANCAQGGVCPNTWPNPSGGEGRIDDLLHAAINGRGSFISAGNTAALKAAMATLASDITTRIGSAAAVATNSIQLYEGSKIYQGTYSTSNWYGELSALEINSSTGEVGSSIWRASEMVPDEDDRMILSYTGATGIVFESSNLTVAQKNKLTASGLGSAEELVDYLRGDTSKNVANGGGLRTRSGVLGDFVHSAPVYFKDMVYIGGNDGMLHGFAAGNGQELFAYVPNLVFDNLSTLAKPGYTHKFFVDNTPMVVDTGIFDILVCGLRKGGKGYFALNVTGSANMAADKVLWEYPNDATGTDDDMGYSYSKAFIVYTEAEGWVVVFGNGYDSTNGEAVLYVLKALTGELIKKLKTGVGGCNGLSTPSLVDMGLDGSVDYAYAGDLKGNLWKFDLRGASSNDWTISYKDGSTPKPLITVKNKSGETQPITVQPSLMLDCMNMTEGRGLMVFFGTGQYLNNNDFEDNTVHSLYGVWDWGPIWEGKESDLTADEDKYLGTLGTAGTTRTLSNMDDSFISLLEQKTVFQNADWLVTSDKPIDFYDPFEDTGANPKQMGWVFDLPQSKERFLNDILIRNGIAIFISTIPSTSPCAVGGSSVIYQLEACSGGRSDDSLFDVDGDGDIDDNDMVVGGGITYAPTGNKVSNHLYSPIEFGNAAMGAPDQEGGLPTFPLQTNSPGMFYWRVLGQ